MTFIRILGAILGVVFTCTYGYILLTEHLSALGSVLGFLVGVLFIMFGITGKDAVQRLYEKLTGRHVSSGV